MPVLPPQSLAASKKPRDEGAPMRPSGGASKDTAEARGEDLRAPPEPHQSTPTLPSRSSAASKKQAKPHEARNLEGGESDAKNEDSNRGDRDGKRGDTPNNNEARADKSVGKDNKNGEAALPSSPSNNASKVRSEKDPMEAAAATSLKKASAAAMERSPLLAANEVRTPKEEDVAGGRRRTKNEPRERIARAPGAKLVGRRNERARRRNSNEEEVRKSGGSDESASGAAAAALDDEKETRALEGTAGVARALEGTADVFGAAGHGNGTNEYASEQATGPPSEAPWSCNGICIDDDSDVAHPDLEIFGRGETCASLKDRPFLDFGKEQCYGVQSSAGVVCGCSSNQHLRNEPDYCSLCSHGRKGTRMPLPIPETVVSYVQTCAAIEFLSSGPLFYDAAGCIYNQETFREDCCHTPFRLIDEKTLRELYRTMDGKNWYDPTGWMTNASHCDWNGVRCDEESMVTHLKLSSFMNSKGDLPTQLGNLLHLEYLNLAGNQLESTMPTELGRLTFMERLYLAYNSLTGKVPSELTQLTWMAELELSHNSLSGTLPETIGDMESLMSLALVNNSLTGTIPSALGTLTQLEHLQLRDNSFTGTLPAELADLEKLNTIDLGGNKGLIGPVPRSWCDKAQGDNFGDDLCPTEVQVLVALFKSTEWSRGCSENNETNICSEDWLECNENGSILALDLSNKGLVGTLPHFIGHLTSLERLSLDSNELTGTLPPHLGNLVNLREMNLSSNAFEGTISPRLARLKKCEVLGLEDNKLHGKLPSDMGRMESLRELKVSRNHLTGTLPTEIGNLANLRLLRLGHNLLEGSLPSQLALLQFLENLQLQNNSISGEIPLLINELGSLLHLDLSDNNIEGTITPNLGQMRFLRTLLMQNNALTGTIPVEIGELALLNYLNLSNNELQGSVPISIGEMTQLREVNLSNNSLSGRIPLELSNISPLQTVLLSGSKHRFEPPAPIDLCNVENFDLQNVESFCPKERRVLQILFGAMKGEDWTDSGGWMQPYESHCEWYGVTCDNATMLVSVLDLAGNTLKGRIPTDVADLPALTVLDLSENELGGGIPGELSKLVNLSTRLRLSFNSFTGSLPESLNNLTRLSVLHLHGNRKLRGTAPIIGAPKLNESVYVADCGSPSLFNKPVECVDCTMCCNSNDECQKTTSQEKRGKTQQAGIFLGAVFAFIAMIFLAFGFIKPLEELAQVHVNIGAACGDSSYVFLLTDNKFAWLISTAAVILQVLVFTLYLEGAQLDFQDRNNAWVYFWRCPPDSDGCKEETNVTPYGWVVTSLLLFAKLGPDLWNGLKLVCASSAKSYKKGSWHRFRFRCLCCGVVLIGVTCFAVWVTVKFNHATARTDLDLILNAVVLFFLCEVDEDVFKFVTVVRPLWVESLMKQVEEYGNEKPPSVSNSSMKKESSLRDGRASDNSNEENDSNLEFSKANMRTIQGLVQQLIDEETRRIVTSEVRKCLQEQTLHDTLEEGESRWNHQLPTEGVDHNLPA